MSDKTSTVSSQQLEELSYEQLQSRLIGSFEGSIEPIKTSLSYRLGIAIVTIVMVLLPIIYIGIIALVGYGIYWHANNNIGIINSTDRPRGQFFLLLLYLTPMIAGGFLFLFMLKPLFASTGGPSNSRSLREEDEPLLFAFVRRICDAVRAPHPKSIDIDSQVNASASFRRGIWSMLGGSDLTLTIGAPLAAGLNTRQFGGVLAHEFGHFSQGAGMRLTYIIRMISHWLTRAVYERDAWDERLVGWSKGIDLRIGWVFYVTRMFVWLTRKILWCLMWVGHAVSGYMLRQMEFDADRHETRLAGNKTFESTARRLAVLNFANQGAQSDLAGFYREGRLGDDMAKLITANASQFDAEALQKINSIVDEQTTGLFDTHPCDTQRIASANSEPTEGIFQVELPASVLFRDFNALSRQVTLDYFGEIFGDNLNPQQLHNVDELLIRQKEETSSYDAIARFFQGTYDVDRPLEIKIPKPCELEKTRSLIRSGRKKLEQMVVSYKGETAIGKTIESEWTETNHAEMFLAGGFKINKKTFSIPLRNQKEISAARQEISQRSAALESTLKPMEQLNAKRLGIALSLLGTNEAKSTLDEFSTLRRETKKLLPLYNQIASLRPELKSLEQSAVFSGMLLQHFQETEADQKSIDCLMQHLTSTMKQAVGIRDRFATIEYPFDHAKEDMTVGGFLFEGTPGHEDVSAIMDAASSVLSNLHGLQYRILGRMCWVAEQLESVVGVEKMPMPAIEETADSEHSGT